MKRLLMLTTLLLTLLSGLSLAEPHRARANSATTNLATLPLMFIESQPQQYQLRLSNRNVWFTNKTIWIQDSDQATARQITLPKDLEVEPINRLETHVSYFIGNDPAKWQTDIPVYGGVRYRNVAPNVNLQVTSDHGQLTWQKEGTGNLPTDIEQWLNDMQAPPAKPESKQALAPLADNTADLVWSTFLGGTGGDFGQAIALDSSGNIYLTGETQSTNFPAIDKALDTSFNGMRDIFVAKFDSSGTSLNYATFLGGLSDDEGKAIALDSSGNIYLMGETQSTNFPATAGAFDTTFNGSTDVFVAKLNSTGTSLSYATFLGGTGGDHGKAIALDSTGNAYLTGNTASTGFPTTAGALDTSYNGSIDVFVAKLNSSGTSLSYATFFGGTNIDYGNALAIDSTGNAYLTGWTLSTNFPTTVGALDTSHNGSIDVFVAKLNSSGTNLNYTTFLGGTGSEEGNALIIDSIGNAYLTGNTNSTNFPTTSGVYDTSHNGNTDVFVAKLNSSGTTLSYATFLGGTGNDSGKAIALDSIGNAYLTGITESSGFPTTIGAFDTSYNGNDDIFVAKLNSNGTILSYATFLGGTNIDYGIALAVDSSDNVYVTGQTDSSNFPTTNGAYDTSFNSSWDVFVSKLSFGSTPIATNTPTNSPTATATATPTNTPTVTPIPPTNTSTSTPTDTPTFTPTPTSTDTPPPINTNTPIPPTATKTPIPPTATNTPIPTPTPNTAPPDAYEIDNNCPEAKPINTDGVPQEHTFHAPNDQDWLVVQLTAGITYVVNVDVPANSQADVTAEIYSNCDTLINPGQNPTFSPGIFYQLTPLTTGLYYLRLLNDLPDKFGSEMRYEISVRPQLTQQNAGALVIVTGRRDKDDLTDLQTNLQTISKNVYQLWRSKGYPPERIYYLATNLELDLDGDKQADVNALVNNTSLKYAITEWTKDKGLGPDRAFTLYLVDHGGRGGRFYLDKPRFEELQSEDLANWLTTLETQAPGVKVNVIIEACYSGGFISRNRPRLLTPLQLLSGPNRVIVTSADEVALAYASDTGGRFSDAFLSSLQQDLSLTEAFKQAKATARQYDPSQIAWLDGDGNGIPNQTSDFAAAALRGFSFSGSFADDKLWPPYIKTASIIPQANGMVEIKAEIRDKETPDLGVTAWAVVYPPSYQPPTDSELLVQSPVPAPFFRRGNNQFAFSHAPFTEVGTYRVVIQAQDKDGLLSPPYQIEFGRANSLLYLPLILK